MDDINVALRSLPIDVNYVNQLSNDLVSTSNYLFKELDEIENYKDLATKAILKGNIDRSKFADVKILLEQAESFYDKLEFRKAYETAFSALEKINHKNGIN